LESHDALARRSQHHIRSEPNQLSRITAKAIGIGGRPADVDPDIASDGPAGLLQALKECCQAGLSVRIVRGRVHQHCNAPHTRRLLRAACQRPSDRTAE